MAGFLDLHAHYLPGIDDGAKDLETSMKMIRGVLDMGFDEICATPHQRHGMYFPSAGQISDAEATLRRALAPLSDAPILTVAAENYWDNVLHARVAENAVPSYPGQKAFLFEVDPGFMPPNIKDALFQIHLGGKLPVMAHPERYRAIQMDLGQAEALGHHAVLVVDLGALDGAYGRAQKKTARRLVEEGLAHACATDTHKPEDQKASAAGIKWLKKRLGPDGLQRLLAEHPRHILAGEIPS